MLSNEQIVYKVLHRKGDKLLSVGSAFQPRLSNDYIIEYRKNTITKPKKGTYLYVFTDVEDAINWINLEFRYQSVIGGIEVWKCYGDVIKSRKARMCGLYESSAHIKNFWKRRFSFFNKSYTCFTQNAKYASNLKLIERVPTKIIDTGTFTQPRKMILI